MASKNDIKVTLDTYKKDELEKWKKSPLEVFVSTRILQIDNIDDGEGKISLSASRNRTNRNDNIHTHRYIRNSIPVNDAVERSIYI